MSVHDLQAPKEDGAILAYPALEQVGALLERNRRLFQDSSVSLLGRPLSTLRTQAQAAAQEAARGYLQEGNEPLPANQGQGLLVAGHQPELFHPGVWLKNFALNGLGKKYGVLPLNLIVDSDAPKSTLLRLPADDRVAQVAFDYGGSEAPFEERPVLAPGQMQHFIGSAKPYFSLWPFQPICEAFWKDLCEQETLLLGERIVRTRRLWERRWGCHNLEAPLSRLCQTEAFAWFACHLLLELPKLHSVYNAAVQGYRRHYGLRSRNHPVPDLAQDGDWLEAPFWAWRAGQGRRQRLWVKHTPGVLELRSGTESWPSAPCSGRPEQLVAVFRDLERHGCKIRTRALTTTLFARLLLADLFVHGIGGGKYDELTDRLFADFLGMTPPNYLVLSGTLLLPFPRIATVAREVQHLERSLRDLYWNPQRYVETAAAQDLTARKQQWIDAPCATSSQRRTRFVELRGVNAALREFLSAPKHQLDFQLAQARRTWEVERITSQRDYAFCLYPQEALRPFLQQFSRR